VAIPELMHHRTCGDERPVLVWRFPERRWAASTAMVGGGLQQCGWVLNAQVPLAYDRIDVHAHVAEIAAELGCDGPGVGLLTAAHLSPRGLVDDDGLVVSATVGVSKPTWAADVEGAISPWAPGTINIVVETPVRLTDAALLNAIVTATEAKSQALFERGIPGTGTASDAVCVVCPTDGPAEPFAGPRSPWGSRIGRAVHAAVLEGLG
jgi:adenosylcobinamide hydrolase